jgi:hypothetical protein
MLQFCLARGIDLRKKQGTPRQRGVPLIKPPTNLATDLEYQPNAAMRWLRAVGGSAMFLGAAGLLTAFYWVGVCSAYIGIALLAVDMWCEPSLESHTRLRVMGLAFISTVALAFSFLVVLVSAPLHASAVTIEGNIRLALRLEVSSGIRPGQIYG